MCGRYTLTVTVKDLMEILPALENVEAILPRYNVAPTQDVLAVANDAPTRLVALHWGLIPRWAKDESIGNRMINARAEGIAEKPAFREAFRRRRCLVLADGFYEWRKRPGSTRKQPVLVRLASGKPFAFAGLWDKWKSPEGPVRSCTVLTTSPNEQVRELHDRMPVILDPSQFDRWLSPDPVEGHELDDLLVPTSAPLALTPVSTLVNSPDNETPDCVEPLVEEPPGDAEPAPTRAADRARDGRRAAAPDEPLLPF